MEYSLERLRSDAGKCRDLASSAMTPEGRRVLSGLADQYEQEALTLEGPRIFRAVARRSGGRRPDLAA